MLRRLAVLLMVASPLAFAQAPEPLHVWHFDEAKGDAVLDAARDYVDIELRGSAKRVDGRFGRAVETGDGGYVEGPSVGRMDAGAVELWAKPVAGFDAAQFGLIGFGNGFGDRNDMALLGVYPATADAGTSRFGFGICPAEWQGVRAPSPSTNEWHHLAANWGPAGMQLFIDGELVAEAEDIRSGVPSHPAVFLGASSWGRTFPAVIDEVRIYAEPLPPEVVAQHHAEDAWVAAPPQPTERVVYYGAAEGASVNAADFASEDSFTSGIQEAIDALPRAGGEVYVSPGTYMLRRSVWLRDNVTLRGAGAGTVLRRPRELATPITVGAEAGASEVQVEDASIFEVWQDVSIYADRVHGWYSTTSPIAAIDGNTITLLRGLNKSVDTAEGAAASNAFPMITAQSSSNVTIRDLTIDGGAPRPNEGVNDFTWAAIHLHNCIDCRVEGCRIRDYICDGISVQNGRGATITGNTVENCRGHGMHPGTGLADSVWSGNISRDNTADGLFFCMGVRHSVVSNNVLANNAGHGIGHIGGGGDKYNVVASNTCVGNGRSGIHVFDGSDNVVSSNLCLNNSQAQPGRWPGIAVIRSTDTVISGNRCLDDQETKTQAAGIAESDESDFNLFTGNQCRGNAGPGLAVTGANSEEQANLQ